MVEGHTDRIAGAVPVSVVLDDGDGNSNVAYTTVLANTLAIDANAPTLLSAETTSTTTIEATFSEDINGSTVNSSGSEFAVTGHTVTGASESSGIVTLTVTTPAMTTNETPDVTFTNIDNFRDLAGNQAVSPATVTSVDGVAPILLEVIPVPTPDNDSTPDYTFSSTEGDTINYGGDCSSSTSAAVVGTNTVTFDSLSDGVHSNCTITVTDSSTNTSLPLAVSSFTIDTVPPSVVISSLAPDPTNTSPVPFTATFSENVTGFTGADIDLVNGILSSFVAASGSVYNFGVVPVIQGLMTVDIDANSGVDAAGNSNTAATQLTRVYDSVPPVITMLGASPVNIEYGEVYVDAGATASDTNDGNITGSIVTVNPVNTSVLGTYTVTYNVSDAAGNNATEVTRTVNVIQRAITVTAVTDTKEYDNTNSSSGTPTITSGSLAGGDSVTWTQTYDNKNVGTGKTLTPAGTVSDGNGGNNYAVTFVNDVTGQITIKNITVTADPQSKTYGDPDPVLTHDGVLLGADAFSGSLSRVSGEDVGTYAINQGTLDAGTNYNITFVSDDLTINQKDITVTADPQSKTYGDPDPVLTYTSDPLILGDSFSGALDRDAGEDAGTYAINQGTLDAGTNYNITFVSDDLTIIPKNITVTANPQTKVYGDADPALTYTNDPLVGTDTFSGSLDRDAGEDVGTYAINQGTLDAGTNYNITFVSDDLTITTLAITGSFTASNKVYDGNTSATISGRSLLGVIGADDVTYTGGVATFSDKNVGIGKTVSGTGFSLTGADAGNYTVNSSAVTTANITARALTVTPSASNKVYDGNNTASVILSDDKVSGDDVVVTNTGATFSDKNVGVGKTVTANFTLSGADLGNYTATASPVLTTANITAKGLTVTATGIDKTYDNTTTATVTLSDDRLSGDVLTATYASASFADPNVGVNKPVSVTGIAISGPDAGNYNLLNTTADTIASIDSPGSSGGGRRPNPSPSPAPASGEVLGAQQFVFTLFLKMGPPYGAGVQNEVMELQKLLNTLGYECGLADGKFGPKTKACVIKFQLANGLKGDGIVGPLTRAALNKPR